MIALSHDHHAGLLFCWKIKEGLRKNIPLDKILGYINFFWTGHLKEHFVEEEALLFNRLDDILTRQGISEHLMLARRVDDLNHRDNENAEAYLSYIELLIKHIRFEERILFPHLENQLPESVLQLVADHFSRKHPTSFNDDFKDEFWSKNYSSS